MNVNELYIDGNYFISERSDILEYNVDVQKKKLEPNDEGIFTICFEIQEGKDKEVQSIC